jgi:CBS domain-containing protein
MSSTLLGLYQRAPDTISPDDSVVLAAERMRQRTVGCLIVVDDANEPIGIVTDRDLVVRVLADGREPSETRVRQAMTSEVVVVTAGVSMSSAVRLMREGTFRRLPVVDDRGHLIGILSLDDVLMELARNLDEVGSVLQQETPAAAAFRA